MKKHQRTVGVSDEWLTPPEIIEALGGWKSFDMDPCDAVAKSNTLLTARYCHSINYNGISGLDLKWYGRVWLNPPFNRYQRPEWMKKMSEHNNGIMLIPAACETAAFHKYVWGTASAICFLKGRPHFYRIDGTRAKANSGCTICLVAYGENNINYLEESNLGYTIINP